MPDANSISAPQVTSFTRSPTMGLAAELRAAFDRAMVNDGKLNDAVLNLPGMSGKKYRILINNLIETLADPRYLEIGVWQGSTLCAAIFGNDVTATAIDNWSQFNGPAGSFLTNLSKFKGAARVSFLERDFREVNFSGLGKFNVYFFDGPHTYKDQFDGIVIAEPALDDVFVLIVDDWNWENVRRGTFAGIRDRGYRIDHAIEIRTTLDDTQPAIRGNQSEWHNGYFIAAMRKS